MTTRILIVEDEPAIAENITYALKTEGFDAVWAATVANAEDVLKADGISLVILDVGLPDGDGFAFCRALRRTSDVPVIFLTARTDEIDRVVGLELGADDYVVKPFSPRELSARVKAILRRQRGQGGNNTPHADTPLTVDTDRHEISYYGIPLDLSRYEYRLLETFMGRPGQVFSRDQLMAQAWDEPDASLDRTVDTHVKTLRGKLRAVRADVDAIITHRGVGYSLREAWPA